MTGNTVRSIDKLDKNSLILICKKLNIRGYSNKNKDVLKEMIMTFLKNQKKMRKTQSTSNINANINDNSGVTVNTKVNHKNITRSNSMPNLTSHVKSKLNQNQNQQVLSGFSNNNCHVYPKVQKLVAIGDIHGDLTVAIKSLKLAGVIPLNVSDTTRNIQTINWVGKDTVVVQVGDQIDRVRPNKLHNNLCIEEDCEIVEDEGSDLKIVCLFERLHSQALKQGGALFSVYGNHELMNVEGDFRYVSPKEFKEFGNYFKGKLELNSSVPYGFKERLQAFKPGGNLSKRLANTRHSVLQVGSWIFVHGGISPECANKYTIDEINLYVKKWLLGDTSDENMKHINYLYHNDNDDNSPFWSRIFSDMDDWNDKQKKQMFNRAINIMNIKNKRNRDNLIKGMIMGHSPQFMYNRGINSSNNNRIWRVDIGASRAFGAIDNSEECKHRKVQVLVIHDDNKFSIVKEKC